MQQKGEREIMTNGECCRYIRTYSELEGLQHACTLVYCAASTPQGVLAQLRREQRRQNNSAVRFFGELILDYSARTVTINNQNIPLSKREFEIVELLSLNAGQVFDRERIYELVWGLDGDGNSDTIMEHIRKIRAKFAAHTLHNYIETVWGCGYRWNA